MKEYKLSSWKLEVKGQYASEEEAIKDLADKYMQCSKCDPPGEHFLELLSGNNQRDISQIGKGVWFYVYEAVYSHKQFVLKHQLTIYPFKQEHWWESVDKEKPFVFEETEFRYKIIEPKEEKV